MKRTEHILVATDFGESSQRAEALAVGLAQKLSAKLTLVHVWSVPLPAYAEGLSWPTDMIEAAARDALARTHARLQDMHPNTEAVLATGPVADRVLETAKERGADLIAIGTHGRRGLVRAFLGSVAERIVRLSPVPVLTVKGEGS